ncbi:methionyl-tRNA formyltransferase [Rubritalea profundi]|uniref:Methionyl-tRNA formyltransferase n=1 Tax=Rubritalea profundi TaxID=1658618 RepID=A0A2S7U6H2_9BACT|nr:methionyl-tRNA formyltransferase [Rubritalea profundi]PQJ29912.1 methionyl-tRNA formyltransferase [Rubritalea profundi]
MPSKRIVYMATGDIAIPAFQALISEKVYNTVALITQPDKPIGRKQVLTPPKIKTIAEEATIPTLQPARVKNEEVLQLLRDLEPDIIVVMAYGQILPKALLEIPKVAIINLHASLLPKHRGASCIQAAIDQGDLESGMTVMHVTEGLDEGDVILKKPFKLPPEITGGELHEILADDGPSALLEALELLFSGEAPRQPQDDSLSNYVSKLMRSDGEIDWNQPAEIIERRIRAYDPWPGASTSFKDTKGRAKRLKIFPQTQIISDLNGVPGEVLSIDDGLTVACSVGALRISELQPDGKRRMAAGDFLRNGQITIACILGE